ncbi:hypothetical protein C5Z25_04720 [Lactobacillus sp. CBA3605]|uniref:hypothetical protein n=1 Tax=Lactobacillus sp. CBA3605 TaxID=2099788 RepID=UPI000CFAF089|nr:hypothetical protein [Lactobacillus sp. CBA3605]AVK61104.1 hypothetical protein C5Z25_04720 [Lactobacillus sp. CBA3605]
MKPLRQDAIIQRLLLVTGIWLIVQLILLPYTLHQNDTVLLFSSFALLAIMVGILGLDSYRAWKQRLNWAFAGIDLLLLIVIASLLLW